MRSRLKIKLLMQEINCRLKVTDELVTYLFTLLRVPQSTGLLCPQTALMLCLTVSFTESSSIACLKQNCGFPSRNMALPQVFFISAKGSTIYLVSQTQYLERHPCVWGYIQVHECCKLYLHIHPWIHSSLSLPPSLSLSDGQCLSMEA